MISNVRKNDQNENGNALKNAYDYQNHLTEMKNQTDSGGMISEYKSEYLINGQKSKETADTIDKDGKKSSKTATYTYDLLGRIRRETKTGGGDISYTYDSNNNRKEMKTGNKVTAYKYNKNDELLRTDTLNTDTEEDSVVIYKNDKNGNQLATVNRYEIPSDKKDSTYVDIDVTLGDNRLNENVVNHYNALNQLTQTLTKNYKVSFTYDAEGLRTSKTVNGEKTVFVWDGDQLVMELSESGRVQKRYIRGNDLVYADKGTETEKQFYVTDPHGNVVQLTDESGKVTKNYEYDSFGNEVKSDGKDDNQFRYCGEYYDKETEEIYLRARYYQPSVGRFLTRDSYTGEDNEPESLHLYVYCGNDGVNAWDPSGHRAENLEKAYDLPKPQKGSPLKIKIKKNKVTITWYAVFLGSTLDERYYPKGNNEITFRDIIKNGIQERWSGTYNIKGYKAKVTTRVRDKAYGYGVPGQKFSTVTFFYKDGISNVSGHENRNTPGKMTLYRLNESNGEEREKADLEIIAAHEFGHILGIKDGYNNSDTKRIDSIMCDQFGKINEIPRPDRKATNIDIEMALRAYKADERQGWYVWKAPN